MAATSPRCLRTKPESSSDGSHETPKRRQTGCIPLIPLTWRANKNECDKTPTTDDGAGSGSGSGSSSSGCSKRRFQRAIPVHLKCGMTRASVDDMSLGGSSSGGCCCSSSSIDAGIVSPKVRCPCRCKSSGFVESDVKGMRVARLAGSTSEVSSSSLSSPPHSSKLYSTPNRSSAAVRPAFNPFESDLIETMNCSSLSPSVFSTVLTPSKEMSDMFNWGVENIAIIYPAEIEENLPQETPSKPLDPEFEEKLQGAINSFFAQKSFAPSPWLDGELPKITASVCPLESSPSLQELPLSNASGKCEENVISHASSKQRKDASCQTVVTLPLDFDFERLLAKYCLFDGGGQFAVTNRSDEHDERQEASMSESRDVLSVSSLRRKLFANNDESPVPSSGDGLPFDQFGDTVFRLNLSPRTPDRKTTPQAAYSSPQFSSSPIAYKRKGMARRTTMTPPTNSASPTLSPIKSNTANLVDHDDDGPATDHDDSASIMSMERSFLAHTSTTGRRLHPHLTPTSDLSIVHECVEGCVTMPTESVASSRTSFMDVVLDECDAAVNIVSSP